MYTSEIITNPDGSTTVKCTRIPQPETRSLEELKDMELMSRAIEAFGTSS